MTLTFLVRFSPRQTIFINNLVFGSYSDFMCDSIKSSNNI
nr:MAG TPA: hypothetical protein [Caudoviricetes sp.]